MNLQEASAYELDVLYEALCFSLVMKKQQYQENKSVLRHQEMRAAKKLLDAVELEVARREESSSNDSQLFCMNGGK